jgi:hypothetical protein
MSVLPGTTSDASALTQGAQSLANGVVGAIQRAARATGVDFGYLVKTAQRESALNPNARARTSSAAGLFQFIEQTWLGMLKTSGARHGYGAYADQIVKGGDGRYHVSDPNARQAVLALRYNPDANAAMAAEMTAGHAAYLRGRIGRDPTQGELYAAHFLGPDGAADLIQAKASRPQASAASLFPQAARANHSIFYSHGRALSVSDVMANLTRTAGDGAVTAAPAAPDADAPDLNADPRLIASLARLSNEQMLLSLVFGGDKGLDGAGWGGVGGGAAPGDMLLNAQLLSAFAPEKDDDDKDAGSGLAGLLG